VGVVDEIADTGETLECVLSVGKSHTGGAGGHRRADRALAGAVPQPVVVSLVTDEFVVFPWGARILVSGRWKPHPEVEAGIQTQHPHDRQG
jgi:hypoxanthine phosphoribosyltransferase